MSQILPSQDDIVHTPKPRCFPRIHRRPAKQQPPVPGNRNASMVTEWFIHPERALCTKQDITASVAWKKCPIKSTTWNFAASFWPLSSFSTEQKTQVPDKYLSVESWSYAFELLRKSWLSRWLTCHLSMPKCSRIFSMSLTRSQVVFSSKHACGVLFPAPLCSPLPPKILSSTIASVKDWQ